MRPALLAILLLAATLRAAAAEADVAFEHPEAFTDVGRDRQHAGRDEFLATLREHLVQQAARVLPAGEKLEVRITDVDMAGDFEPRTGSRDDVRVLGPIDPPKIALRFRLLAADGSVRQEGERHLVDQAYLRAGDARSSTDPLRFEKALLDVWLAREFPRRDAAR